MISKPCRLASIAIGAFALAVFAAAPAFASGHEVYPPGWNTPRDPGPVIYTYDPVDLSMHHVAGAPELKLNLISFATCLSWFPRVVLGNVVLKTGSEVKSLANLAACWVMLFAEAARTEPPSIVRSEFSALSRA